MIIYGTDNAWEQIRRAPQLVEALDPPAIAPALEPAYWMLEQAASAEAIKLAPSGRLGRKVVQDGEARFDFTDLHSIGHKPQNQDDVPALVALRELLTKLRLVRAYKGKLVATKRGKDSLTARGDADRDRIATDIACRPPMSG